MFEPGLGLRSDLVAAPAGLVAAPFEGVLRLRIEARDDYHAGNRLELPAPPRAADVADLLARWQRAFGDAPGVKKVLVQWETDLTDDVDARLEAAAAEHG